MASPSTARQPRGDSTATATPDPKDQRITVRVSAAQRALLDAASRSTDATLTDFILDAATARANNVLADRRRFTLAREEYAAFVGLLDRPIKPMPKLARLLAEPTDFDD